jgi:hypothetical protein
MATTTPPTHSVTQSSTQSKENNMATLVSNLGIIPNYDHFVKFQSCLFSFNNGALYTNNGSKASVQFLVPMGACALVQLQTDLNKAVECKYFAYAERLAGDINHLNRLLERHAIARDVAQYIADNTPYRV